LGGVVGFGLGEIEEELGQRFEFVFDGGEGAEKQAAPIGHDGAAAWGEILSAGAGRPTGAVDPARDVTSEGLSVSRVNWVPNGARGRVAAVSHSLAQDYGHL